ncbi:MAG: DUF3791 domain-containing protein [Bifidobacteriaceae bacterium]|nr:DUF3791 domain-containing protein [Bifidobacteriaceae bacterium]
MDKGQATATWVFFMLTAVRRRLDLEPAAFIPYCQRHRLIRFLFDNHELLHLYDNDYVVDDVLRHVTQQEGGEREFSTTR